MVSQERRRDTRTPLNRPVKVRCLETGRYLAGRTDNLSASGALLQVFHPSLLIPGQRLRLGISWTNHEAVLDSTRLVDATVVRSAGRGPVQQVAVAFSHRQALAMAG